MAAKKIVYIIGTYPLLTTTFIDREILRLIELGVDLKIFSIRKPPRHLPLSSFQLELQKGVRYLLPIHILTLIMSQIYFALFKPKIYFGTLAFLVSRPHPHFSAIFKTILHFGEGVYFAYFLRKEKIHEIHAHFLDRSAVLAMVARRLLDVPYSLSIHAGADIYVHPVLIHEKLEESRKAVTCTQFNIKHLASLVGEIAKEKITFIPHGLDASIYIPADQSNGTFRILSVGQLKMRKGFLQLIDVCKRLNEEGYDFSCDIIGQGPLRTSLEEKISQYALNDKVTLCGALPHEEVLERYQTALMFVLPCIQTEEGDVDGIPNVLLEAMAMKLPVISTRVSAIPELVVDQKNGVLVNSNDEDELFDAVIDLYMSPEKRAQLGGAGRQTVLSDFNINTNIDHFVKTLWPELIQ